MSRTSIAFLVLALLVTPLSPARIEKRPGVDIPTRVVIIKKGDTLRKLAERFFGSRDKWREFLKTNIIPDPDHILPGEKLYVPILPSDGAVSQSQPVMLLLQPTEDDTPELDVNPVMTEHIIVVKAIDQNGSPVEGARVEWVLSDFPSSTGDIVEADDTGKINNRYAVTYTNRDPVRLKRSPRDGRDLLIGPGETWIGITSAYPGETRVAAICPAIPMDKERMVFATCRWIDIAWRPPPDLTAVLNYADNSKNFRELAVKVFKATDGSPIEGAEVEYAIIDSEGPVEPFLGEGESSVKVRTDANGEATAILKIKEPAQGKARIEVKLLDERGEPIFAETVEQEWLGVQMSLEVWGPERVGAGNEVEFRLKLNNTGDTAVRGVQIEVRSDAFKLIDRPAIDELKPGQAVELTLRAIPVISGKQICTFAAVSPEGIECISSTAVEVVPPRMTLSTSGPDLVKLMEEFALTIRIDNVGEFPIRNARATLSASEGIELEREELDLGDVEPGGAVEGEVKARAVAEGVWTVKAAVSCDGGKAEGEVRVRVAAPRLKLSLSKKLIPLKVSEKATLTVTVSNDGGAPAEGVSLSVDSPPEGLRISPRSMKLGDIEPGGSAEGSVEIMPLHPGRYDLKLRASCLQGIEAEADLTVVSVSRPEIRVVVTDDPDPGLAGGEVVYRVKVSNVGTEEAKSVELTASFPPQLAVKNATSSKGEASVSEGRATVRIGSLSPGEEVSLTFKVEALEPGDLIVRFTVKAAPPIGTISAEEMTSVIGSEGGR